MSYVVPSVLVYQQLATNAGVANITPDLDSCIIGPCYNVVNYDTTSSATLLSSWATNQAGTANISLAADVVPVDTYLPSTKPGQLVDLTSVLVYLNNAQVETNVAKYTSHSTSTGSTTPNTLTMYAGGVATQVTIVNNSKNVTITSASPATYYVNDVVTITGAGANDTDLTTTIKTITDSTHFIVADNCKVGTAGATGLALTRIGFQNLNSNSSTLRVEPGDIVGVTAGSGAVFYSTVLSLTSVNNVVSNIFMADNLPTAFTNGSNFTTIFRKTHNNLLLPITYNSVTNYDISNVTVTNDVQIQVNPQVSYGIIRSGEVHLQYRAMREDLQQRLIEVNTPDDIVATFGLISDQNPIALALELALANTTGRIMAITVATNDLAGYLSALDLAASNRLYTLVPLTQDIAILETFQQHVDQLSIPEKADWRVTLVNTAIPKVQAIGTYTRQTLNTNGGNNSTSATTSILTSSNSTFVTDGVLPGDTVTIVAAGPVTTTYIVNAVVSNQMVQLVGTVPALTGFGFFVTRTLTKVQQAAAVAAVSSTFADSRVVHIQPDTVGVTVSGVVKYLPGFYLCAAISGLMSGLPAQQGLTLIGVAGISDLQNSNFYFTRAQIDTMAAAGTFLVVQQSQGNIPYVRHSLTTDMTVLQYREIQQVKNIDFLSYYFYDKLKGFAGRWNITPDTLQTVRSTIDASGKNLIKQTLPKIGAPLLSFQITLLEQDAANQDQINVRVPVKIPTVMNYINLYLIV